MATFLCVWESIFIQYPLKGLLIAYGVYHLDETARKFSWAKWVKKWGETRDIWRRINRTIIGFLVFVLLLASGKLIAIWSTFIGVGLQFAAIALAIYLYWNYFGVRNALMVQAANNQDAAYSGKKRWQLVRESFEHRGISAWHIIFGPVLIVVVAVVPDVLYLWLGK